MPTEAVIKVIQTGLNIASKTLHFIPFKIVQIHDQYLASKSELNGSIKKLWKISATTSLIITSLEMYYSLYSSNPINLVTLFYHVIQILVKIAAFVTLFAYHTKQQEFSFLLKCFCTRPDLIVIPSSLRHHLKSNNGLFLILLTVVTHVMIIFFSVALPIVIILFPCFHENISIFVGRISCNSILSRCIILIFHGPFMVMIGVVAYLNATFSLVTVHEITNGLLKLL